MTMDDSMRLPAVFPVPCCECFETILPDDAADGICTLSIMTSSEEHTRLESAAVWAHQKCVPALLERLGIAPEDVRTVAPRPARAPAVGYRYGVFPAYDLHDGADPAHPAEQQYQQQALGWLGSQVGRPGPTYPGPQNVQNLTAPLTPQQQQAIREQGALGQAAAGPEGPGSARSAPWPAARPRASATSRWSGWRGLAQQAEQSYQQQFQNMQQAALQQQAAQQTDHALA